MIRMENMQFYILIVAFIIGVRANNPEIVCTYNPLVEAINDFTTKIARRMDSGNNVFFSPFYLYLTLATMELGAGGETKSQIRRVTGFDKYNLTETELHTGLGQLISLTTENPKDYDLLAANGIFIEHNYPVIRKYIEELKLFYDADLKQVNFGDHRINEFINSWVSEKTKGMIRNFYAADITSLTRAALLSVVYFKGTWETTFYSLQTAKREFFNGTSPIEVDMMSMSNNMFSYFADNDTQTQYLKLPYKGEHIFMLIALPAGKYAPANLIVDHNLLCHIRKSLKKLTLNISIPKFKYERESDIKNILIEAGIKDLFTLGAANLTGIARDSNTYVSSLHHKASIQVDEAGSKAATVMMGRSGGPFPSDPPINFLANHPFCFYIIDDRTELILFAGKVTNPYFSVNNKYAGQNFQTVRV